MLGSLLLAAAMAGAAILGLLELRDWWRPLAPSGSLSRRWRSAETLSRRSRWRPPAHWIYASLSGLAAGGFMWLLTRLAPFGIGVGLAAVGITAYAMPRWQRRSFTEKARAELKVALNQLVLALRAGQSLSTALQALPRALTQALGPGRWILPAHVARVSEDLTRGATPEEALQSLADRLGLEEVRLLVQIVKLARDRGGDLSLVVAQAAQMLAERIEIRTQILTLTAGKRMEGIVVTLAPPIILSILWLENPAYMAPLVQTNLGRMLLAVAIVLETASFFLGRWLMSTEV